METKDSIRLKIDTLAFGGAGVGRINNFVVFVPLAAPGDELEIEITAVKKKYARGRILRIIRESPERTKPLCRYYGQCGGCCYQHLQYASQLAVKKKQVEESFRKIGKISLPPVADTLGSPSPYHYRGKAQLHVAGGAGGIRLGFMDISGGSHIGIERCEIMEETINSRMVALQSGAKNLIHNESRVTIWSGDENASGNKRSPVKRIVNGKEFLVSGEGFFQANLSLTGILVNEVCRLATAGSTNTVIDAYCGCGLFSVFLAPYFQKVIGIEANEKAVNLARINAVNSGAVNAAFLAGDTGKVLLKSIIATGLKADLLILDPPRTGCGRKTLEAIRRLNPQNIIYISCNPATQARDVKFLATCGYHLQELIPVDMFPQTEHIEVIGFLSRE